jgi:hypothetical protein
MDERDDLEQAQPSSQGEEQEPQGLVPPHEGRQTEAREGLGEQMDKVFHRVDEVLPGPGREVSEEEREGVPATDTEARSPLGVGESVNRRGESVARRKDEAGREHTGTKGASDRPVGMANERDASAVNPDQARSGGPHLPPGDQGG